MATVKYSSIVEQNFNMLQGILFSSATFAGTNTGVGDLVVRVGREPPVVSILGTQTCSNSYIALDHFNAYHGATVTVKRQMGTMGTGIITIVDGSAAGATIGIIPASANGSITCAFDGVAEIWR